MHNSITRSAAKAIFAKCESAMVPIAVFVSNGSCRTTKVTTQLFSEAIKKTPGRLMGVYDGRVLLDHLEDDLEYMGVR